VSTARPILELMQTPPEIIDDAERYITVIYWGIFASMLFNLMSNIIRALGDSRTPLFFLVIACLVNIVLDFAFIRGLHMGVEGASIATVISQALSGVLCIVYMLKKLPFLRFQPGDWKMQWVILAPHLRVSLPMGFQSSIIAIGSIILQWALNQLGATAVASFTAAQKIDQLATQPLMSFGITMATYAAQNYGAGNIPRIRTGVRQCTYMSVAASILGGLLTILGGPFLVQLFVGEQPEVISLAQIYLRINGATYFILALLFIYRYTLQGLGFSLVPTVAGIMELVMRTLAALVLAAPLGFAGVSMANPIAWIGATVPLSIAYFLTVHRLARRFPAPAQESAAPSVPVS
jgi:putative MATE family efflux protein